MRQALSAMDQRQQFRIDLTIYITSESQSSNTRDKEAHPSLTCLRQPQGFSRQKAGLKPLAQL